MKKYSGSFIALSVVPLQRALLVLRLELTGVFYVSYGIFEPSSECHFQGYVSALWCLTAEDTFKLSYAL